MWMLVCGACFVESEIRCTMTIRSVPSISLLQLNFRLEPSLWKTLPLSFDFPFSHPLLLVCRNVFSLLGFNWLWGSWGVFFFFFLGFCLPPLFFFSFCFFCGFRERGRDQRTKKAPGHSVPTWVLSSGKGEGCFWDALLSWAASFQPKAVPDSLLWHGERIFPSENCHGAGRRPSCEGAVSAYLLEHKDRVSLACIMHCCCSLLTQSRAVIRFHYSHTHSRYVRALY